MDPLAVIVAALEFGTEAVRAYEKFYDGASPEQKILLVQAQLDRDKWLFDFIAKFKIPGG